MVFNSRAARVDSSAVVEPDANVDQRQPGAMGTDSESPPLLSNPQMCYQDEYVWFILVSSLDIALTWVILSKGGIEVNPVASMVITYWGFGGAIAFKFCLALFVIMTCEYISRQRMKTGRQLIRVGIFISSIPVGYSLFLLARFLW